MKKLAVLCCLFILSASAASALTLRTESKAKAAPANIVEYFLLLPSDLQSRTVREMNYSERFAYMTGEGASSFKIDIPNGYLRFDGETDQLKESQTIAIFKKKDGTKIIGISIYMEGGDADSYYYAFYKYSAGTWTEITETVLPKIPFSAFLPAGTAVTEDVDKAQLHYNTMIVLPQYGTTALFKPTPYPREFDLGLDESQQEEYYSTFESIAYQSIELKWKAQKGVFEIGAKKPN